MTASEGSQQTRDEEFVEAVAAVFNGAFEELNQRRWWDARDYLWQLRRRVRAAAASDGDIPPDEALELTPREVARATGLVDDPWTPTVKMVPCGDETCTTCPHGPYLYYVKRHDERSSEQVWEYIGPGSRVAGQLPATAREDFAEAPVVGGEVDNPFTEATDGEAEVVNSPEAEDDSGHLSATGDGGVDIKRGRVGPASFEAPSGVPKGTAGYVFQTGDEPRVVGYTTINPFEYRYNSTRADYVRDRIRRTAERWITTDGETVPIPEEERVALVADIIGGINGVSVNPVAGAELPTELRDFASVGRRDAWTKVGYGSQTLVAPTDASTRRDAPDAYPVDPAGRPLPPRGVEAEDAPNIDIETARDAEVEELTRAINAIDRAYTPD